LNLYRFGGDLCFIAFAFDDFGEQPFFAALLLSRFFKLLFDIGDFSFRSSNALLLGLKVTSDEQGSRNEIGFEAALCLLEILFYTISRGFAPSIQPSSAIR
jgi:hypothetical protein